MMTEQCTHDTYERKEVRLSDGFSYHYFQCPTCGMVEYPLGQAQKLLDYSKGHQFMFVEDWIIAWMAVKTGSEHAPAPDIAAIQKQLFVLTLEFAPQHCIPTEDPGYTAYESGPYAHRIERALRTLDEAGLMTSKGRMGSEQESFCLTESGRKRGESLLSSFGDNTKHDLEALKADLRRSDPTW